MTTFSFFQALAAEYDEPPHGLNPRPFPPGREENDIERLGRARSPAEHTIITGIRGGDQSVFDTFYIERYDALWRFAVRFVHDAESAEDIVHDVFLSLWRIRSSWEPTASVDAYLYTAVRNRALQRIRHLRVVDQAVASGALEQAASAASVEPVDLQRDAERAERHMALRQAIRALSERQATALYLRWQRDLTYPEIAAVLGVSAQAARTLVLRVQERLRGMLQG